MPKIKPSPKPSSVLTIDPKWLGDHVRYIRTSMGLSLVHAAGLCGLSKTAYSNVELGKNTRVDTLFVVLNNFGVRLSLQQEDPEETYLFDNGFCTRHF